MYEAVTTWGDARQDAIDSALVGGRAALESGDQVSTANWLATCVSLLTPPRRANDRVDSDVEANGNREGKRKGKREGEHEREKGRETGREAGKGKGKGQGKEKGTE